MPELFALLPMLMVLALFLYYLSCNPGPGEGLPLKMFLRATRIATILLFAIAVVIMVWALT